jgi:hypothetical protein
VEDIQNTTGEKADQTRGYVGEKLKDLQQAVQPDDEKKEDNKTIGDHLGDLGGAVKTKATDIGNAVSSHLPGGSDKKKDDGKN